MNGKITIVYDPSHDVLYYNLPNSGNAYGDEGDHGIVTFHDFDTDEVTGYTIFNFKKNYNEHGDIYKSISNLFNIKEVFEQYCM